VGTASASLTVPPVDDSAFEPSEGVTLTLGTGTGYTRGTPNTASGTISDNESPAQISVADATVTEADSGSPVLAIQVSLLTAFTQTVTVTATTVQGSAQANKDYKTTTTTLTFAPGVTTLSFNV